MKIRKRYRGGRRVAKKEDDSELGYILFRIVQIKCFTGKGVYNLQLLYKNTTI